MTTSPDPNPQPEWVEWDQFKLSQKKLSNAKAADTKAALLSSFGIQPSGDVATAARTIAIINYLVSTSSDPLVEDRLDLLFTEAIIEIYDALLAHVHEPRLSMGLQPNKLLLPNG